MNDKILDFVSSEDKNDVRVVMGKNNKTYVMVNKPNLKNNIDPSLIKLYDDNCNSIGKIEYFFNKEKNSVVLDYINVEGKEHEGQGLGFYLSKFLEEITYKKQYKQIYGLFFPDPGKEESSLKFYEKNDFIIKPSDGYYWVAKPVTQNKYLNTRINTRPNQFGYKQYRSIEHFNKSLKTKQQLNELSKNPA